MLPPSALPPNGRCGPVGVYSGRRSMLSSFRGYLEGIHPTSAGRLSDCQKREAKEAVNAST
jgi:hypothetical protein